MDKRAIDPNPQRRVTIKDVAKVAGVAPSTVSKSLNDSPTIPEETRARVKEAATLIGYRPNAVARSLRAGLSRSIGAVTDDTEGMFSTLLVRGLEHHAQSRDYTIFLSNSLSERERERRHVQAFVDSQVDALVIMDAVVRPRGAPSNITIGMPLVYMYCYPAEGDVTSVVPDDIGAGHLVTQHLLDQGRRSIAYLGGPATGPAAFEATAHRFEGYHRAHRDAGLTPDQSLVRAGDWDARSGYQLMAQLLATEAEIDGVVCVNDYVAVGAIEALRLAGRGVPDDVAVTGFDNRAISSGLSIPLTTVAVDYEAIGRLTVEAVFAAIDGTPHPPTQLTVPSQLVVRASSGGPA